MKIGELAQRAGMAASAIRYYEQLGLLPKPVRGVNGYRVYGDSALERLHQIQIGQNLGFFAAGDPTGAGTAGQRL
ncbi:MerR family DNA-binding transcriptional regulator [Serratia marcescens]|uniref:MerR family DNA-binding transcriptional regulator n=1 Tax=Serratia marcescens TaxID=615 RepID=UPI001F5B8599|nr:MerR family DNA-binding transcriptional regulator [Serratia marcescens]